MAIIVNCDKCGCDVAPLCYDLEDDERVAYLLGGQRHGGIEIAWSSDANSAEQLCPQCLRELFDKLLDEEATNGKA